MQKVEIYTSVLCGYCSRAKNFLDQKGVIYEEFDITSNDTLRKEMIKRSNTHIVPQIFLNGQNIGGYDDLMMLEQEGVLDSKLGLVK
tara:strand:- start:16493 stop:16753 length:261 start_codon:yes stop_codon:yes gene_type:complete